MKKHTTPLVVLVAVLLLGGPVAAEAAAPLDDDPKEAIAKLNDQAKDAVSTDAWNAFSKNLVKALQSDHDGLRETAMRYVIQYGEHLKVKGAVFDVMRIYRNHDNEALRRMAIVTLGSMKSTWAIDFLSLSEDYENNPALKQTIRAVVDRHRSDV